MIGIKGFILLYVFMFDVNSDQKTCLTFVFQNTSHYTAQVTLFNTMEPQPRPDGTMMEPRIHLQVPVLCTYRKNLLISMGSMGPMGSQG